MAYSLGLSDKRNYSQLSQKKSPSPNQRKEGVTQKTGETIFGDGLTPKSILQPPTLLMNQGGYRSLKPGAQNSNVAPDGLDSKFKSFLVEIKLFGVISENGFEAAENLKPWHKEYLLAHRDELLGLRTGPVVMDVKSFSELSKRHLEKNSGTPQKIFKFCDDVYLYDDQPVVLPGNGPLSSISGIARSIHTKMFRGLEPRFQECLDDLEAAKVISNQSRQAAQNLKPWHKEFLCNHKQTLIDTGWYADAIDLKEFGKTEKKFLHKNADTPGHVFEFLRESRHGGLGDPSTSVAKAWRLSPWHTAE